MDINEVKMKNIKKNIIDKASFLFITQHIRMKEKMNKLNLAKLIKVKNNLQSAFYLWLH